MSARRHRHRLRPLALALALGLSAASLGAQTTLRALAFGDSITEGVGDDPNRGNPGYPPRLRQLLATVGVSAQIDNRGKGGEATMEGLTRLDDELVTARSGDLFLLMEGTNDISRKLSLESTILNLDAMAKKAENKGMVAYHATVIPRRPDARVDPLNLANDQLNGLIRNLAGVRNRRLVDPYQVFGAIPNYFATLYSQATDDPVGHPNAAGYDLLARIFAEVLRNLDTVPPVPGIVTPVSGTTNALPNATIAVDVWDFGAGIDLGSTFLVVNGTTVAAIPAGDSKLAKLSYVPTAPLSGDVTVGLRSRDLANPPNAIDQVVARFTVPKPVLNGDIDKDNRVNGNDLILLALAFGSNVGSTRYNAAADLNKDDTINGQDLAILAANFGRIGAP